MTATLGILIACAVYVLVRAAVVVRRKKTNDYDY